MRKVDIKDTDSLGKVLTRIRDEWMLITAGTEEKLNTMTASWGGVGVLWGKLISIIYIRPERYTYGFIEESDYYSIAFFNKDYKKALALCGSKSGRDIDKVKECGFTVKSGETAGVYFEQADLVLVCKKCYRDELETDRMIGLDPSNYYGESHGGVHTMYFGEIVEIYQK